MGVFPLPSRDNKNIGNQYPEDTMKTVIGIDFGTSNTVVSKKTFWCDEISIIDLGFGEYIPTVVRLNEKLENGDAFGQDAYENYESYPFRTFLNFKIEIEKNFPDRILKTANIEFLKLLKYAIQENQYGGEDIDFTDTEIVVGIPGHWLPFRERVADLFENAGFTNIKTFPEPLAAAIFILAKTHCIQNIAKKTILIIDCGAGTTDLSILEWKENKSVLPLSLGGTTIAGNNFDSVIAKDIESKLNLPNNNVSLNIYAKEIKENLTYNEKTLISIYDGTSNKVYNYETDRTEFAQNSAQLLSEIKNWVLSTLTQQHIDISSIGHIFLTGGMALCPILKDSITELTANTNCVIDSMTDYNPQSVVVMGLASSSELIPKIIDEKGKELCKSLENLKLNMYDELANENNKKLLDRAIESAVEEAWPSISKRELILNVFNKDKLKKSKSIIELQKAMSKHLEPCLKSILDSVLIKYRDCAEKIIMDSFQDLGQLFENNLYVASVKSGAADQSETELSQVGKNFFMSLFAALIATACSTMVITTSTAMLGLIVTTVINPVFLAATIISAIIAASLGKNIINLKARVIKKICKTLTTIHSIDDLSSETGKKTIYAKMWNPNDSGAEGLNVFFSNFYTRIWEKGYANAKPLKVQLLNLIEGNS